MTGYLPAVAGQIEELVAQYAAKTVLHEPNGSGGAYIVIDSIDPGPAYIQRESWLGFVITHQCPDADIYPVFLSGELRRVDGKPHTPPFTPTTWHDRSALQFSLRSPHHNPAIDTAAIKAAGVVACLAERS
ncbi:hypothetical protein KDK95_26615 [Actinospica sp. MGRD01-02]|uniref:Uncharacterized protein n=1 Tax=Actinospica acidithermotolerans TaxID=2828514 RepID=A0A941EEA2_9ACTN|nr:hypothetical protein [Actinospica acidithermotolerans]MBR7829906.1 hypothetical protein [Actinospica acidithermotolerans]